MKLVSTPNLDHQYQDSSKEFVGKLRLGQLAKCVIWYSTAGGSILREGWGSR